MWAKNQVGVVWATCRRHVVKKEVGVRWATCGRTARWALCGRHVGDMQSFFIQKTDGLSTCRQHVGVRWGTNLLCRRHVGDMQAFSPFRLHFRQHHVSEGSQRLNGDEFLPFKMHKSILQRSLLQEVRQRQLFCHVEKEEDTASFKLQEISKNTQGILVPRKCQFDMR